MNGFWDLDRTDERMNEQEWIRRSQFRSAGDQQGLQSKLGQTVQEMLIWGDFGDFYTTQPPEMAKIWSHGAA